MLLEVRNLTVLYGTVKAFENVSFTVNEAEIIAIVGPNGAGKSTTLKAISGMLETLGGHIKEGEIEFLGESVKGLRTDQLVCKGMSLVPDGRRIFTSMTVLENIEMGAYIKNDKAGMKENIERVFTLFPRLRERKKQIAGTLSTGEQQMLALGRALILKPKLLLADEPSVGLSPNFVDLLFDKLVEINKDGTSILLVEQNTRMALEICHRGYVFEVGSIALEGSRESLISNDEVRKVYLGV